MYSHSAKYSWMDIVFFGKHKWNNPLWECSLLNKHKMSENITQYSADEMALNSIIMSSTCKCKCINYKIWRFRNDENRKYF